MTAALLDLARSWWEWCAPVSLQVAVMYVIVAALDGLLRRRTPPGGLAVLWMLVLVRWLVPPSLESPMGLSMPWDALGPITAQPTEPSREALAAFLVWLSGCCILGGVAISKCRGLRREWLGGASRPPPAGIAGLAREAAGRLGLASLPEVHVVESAAGPAVVGFLRPIVVLPAGFIETATREELIHVLLHELAHVKRRDPLLQLLCLVSQVVFWFHPSIWLARRRLSALTEICCDEAVVAADGGCAAGYRRTLLQLARPMLAPRPFGSLHFFPRRSQLLLRVERLARLDGRGGVCPCRRRILRRALAGCLWATVLLCSLTPVRPRAGALEFTPLSFESLEGCLQLRYAVQAAVARQSLDR